MKLEEARERHADLEQRIRDLIEEFERETGMIVEDIVLQKWDATTVTDEYRRERKRIEIYVGFLRKNDY